MQKTAVWPLCFIINNGGHVFYQIKIFLSFCAGYCKEQSYQVSSKSIDSVVSEGEDVWRIVNDDRRWWQRPSDGNNSHCLQPGELKMSSRLWLNKIRPHLTSYLSIQRPLQIFTYIWQIKESRHQHLISL